MVFSNTTTIENCTIDASGIVSGILGNPEIGGATLFIENATVKAKGGSTDEGGSMLQLLNIILNNCAITTPAQAVFNPDEAALVDFDGNIITEQVVIEPMETYPLYLAGIQVTENNAADLSAIEGVDGAVSYNDATKTLTLNGATIKDGDRYYEDDRFKISIDSSIKDLTINLIGNNKLEAENIGLLSFRNIKINGYGTLTTTASHTEGEPASAGIVAIGNVLVIENCTIDAFGFEAGIRGSYQKTLLIVKDATVKAKSEIENISGSIKFFPGLILFDCAITAPEGAIFDADEHGVVDANGNLVTEQIVIEPTTGIQDVENMKDIAIYPNPVNDILHVEVSENNFGVELYNIFGQQVLKAQNEREISVSELSSGVYVLKITTEKGIYSRKIVKE